MCLPKNDYKSSFIARVSCLGGFSTILWGDSSCQALILSIITVKETTRLLNIQSAAPLFGHVWNIDYSAMV